MFDLKTKKIKGFLIVIDGLIVLISLFVAIYLRSRFEYFYFYGKRLYYIIPYVIILRLFLNNYFESYSLSYENLKIKDIAKIFEINILSTLIFALFRFFAPVEFIKMPLSIIFSEYVFTSTFMMLVRLIIVRSREKDLRYDSLNREALLLTSDRMMIDNEILKLIKAKYFIDISGILTEDTSDWGTDYHGVRILGGIKDIYRYVIYDNYRYVILTKGFNKDKVVSILKACSLLGVHVYVYKDGALRGILPEDVIGGIDRELNISSEIEKKLNNFKICIKAGGIIGYKISSQLGKVVRQDTNSNICIDLTLLDISIFPDAKEKIAAYLDSCCKSIEKGLKYYVYIPIFIEDFSNDLKRYTNTVRVLSIPISPVSSDWDRIDSCVYDTLENIVSVIIKSIFVVGNESLLCISNNTIMPEELASINKMIGSLAVDYVDSGSEIQTMVEKRNILPTEAYNIYKYCK